MSLIHTCFENLYGKPCWGVRQGYASCLLLEFGSPSLEVQKVRTSKWRFGPKKLKKKLTTRDAIVRGEWHLWINCCNWVLELAEIHSVHSEQSRRKIADALAVLNGQELVSVSIDQKRGTSVFEFDLKGRLSTTPYDRLDSTGEPYDNWDLFEPSGYVLTYRGDGKFRHQPGDKPPLPEEWMTL